MNGSNDNAKPCGSLVALWTPGLETNEVEGKEGVNQGPVQYTRYHM